MFESLIEIVDRIWQADRTTREDSVVGQSEMDRKSGRWIAWICGGLITVLVVAAIAWEWFVEWR